MNIKVENNQSKVYKKSLEGGIRTEGYYKNKPLISIISVVCNCERYIETTIKSVLAHLNDSIEYIIVDGYSNDNTMEIVKSYNNKIDYWISEKDEGIYDAMNKGITKAKGDFVYFINAGDELKNIPFDILMRKSEFDLIAFPVVLSSGKIMLPKINSELKIRNTLPHQGCFYKRSTNLKYNTSYKIFADFDLNQRLLKSNKIIEILQDPTIAYHDLGGVSNDRKYSNEIFEVIRNNYGVFYKILSWFYFKKEGLVLRVKKLFLR